MAGKIKELIDYIVEQKTHGNHALAGLTRAKMCMKGIFPEKYTETSEDDPIVIEKLKAIAKDLNIEV